MNFPNAFRVANVRSNRVMDASMTLVALHTEHSAEGISYRRIEDLQDNDELFHVLYDLDDRIQIPGTRFIWGGRRYTPDSAVPKWRGIRDDQGRITVFNPAARDLHGLVGVTVIVSARGQVQVADPGARYVSVRE